MNNLITYILFLVLFFAICADMYFCTNIILQIFCIFLLVLLVSVSVWCAYKLQNGKYCTHQQIAHFQNLVSEIAHLQNENTRLAQLAKQTVKKDELKNVLTINARLTHQIANLQQRHTDTAQQLAALKKDLQTAQQTAQQTPVLLIDERKTARQKTA